MQVGGVERDDGRSGTVAMKWEHNVLAKHEVSLSAGYIPVNQNKMLFKQLFCSSCIVNNYIVRSYRDLIVVANIVRRRTSKTQSMDMY